MKRITLLAAIFAVNETFAQCPFTANLAASGECPGASLTVSAAKNISSIEWIGNGTTLGTSLATASYNPVGVTVAGGNGPGLGANQLDHPQALQVDLNGTVIVADENNARVQAWVAGSAFGTTLISSYGSGSDPLVSPVGVFFDGYNNTYVSDYAKWRVQKWPELASVGITVAGGSPAGSAAGQLNTPIGIYFDIEGNLYIADVNNNRVQEYASDATSGVTVAGGNGAGSAAGQLQGPTDVFVDAAGNMYVVDNGNNRVQKWARGATSGVTVAGGNGAGAGANQLNAPYGVYVDGFGNVFVADAGNNRIQEWAPGAITGVTVAGGNGAGPSANQLNDPRFVWMDGSANLYVSDDLNDRVQKFTLQNKINNSFTAASPGVYSAVVTYSTGCTARTNPVTIQGSVSPAISIGASVNPANVCTNVGFLARWSGAGSSPTLQWQVNGTNVPGANQPVYQTGTLKNGDVVSCILTPVDACISTTPIGSNSITMGINGLPEATMISKPVYCPGDTLAITSGDSLSQIVWSLNSTPVSTVNATPVGSAITVAGGNGPGSAANQLYSPTAVVVDAQGNVYVADGANNRIMKWAPGASSGTNVTVTQLNYPPSIAVDGTGDVYVPVNQGAVIECIPGSYVTQTVAGGNGKGIGSNEDQLNTPIFIFRDAAGDLYIADLNNWRVQEWAPGATSGVTVAGGNGPGQDNSQIGPGPIFVDGSGNLYIVDTYNNRVMKWAPGASSGVPILTSADLLFNPTGIWVDPAGNIYLSDAIDNSVKKYAPGSKTGVTVAGGNGAGSASNQLNNPRSIVMDANGNLYVTDGLNNRVQEFLQHSTIDSIYTAGTPGTYSAAVTTSGGCVLYTNPIVVKPFVSPSLSVNASATEVCSNNPVTLTAVPANGGSAPVYAWQVNGVGAGTNSPVFTTTLPGGVSTILCKMTGNADCSLQPSATSNPIAITVDAAVTPAVSISTASTNICSGADANFVAAPVNGGSGPIYQWTVNGFAAGANSPQFSSNSLANGDVVVCQMSSDATCTTSATAASNAIVMTVKAAVAVTLEITATPDPVCSGMPVSFSTSVTNGGAVQHYQWMVNGSTVGGDGPSYTSSVLADGDVVYCHLTTDEVCAAAVSNSVVMKVDPTPVIAPNQVFLSTPQGVTLVPVVSGDIAQYSWTPATGLSATDVADPVADPARSVTYTLTVVATDGCTASGEIAVKVYSDIRIPGAFTPNGDGRNDIFYVLGGPQGSAIKDLSVFDRWGNKVFQVEDVAPGDPSYGWNGTYKGAPCMSGTYVYSITVVLAGGRQQVFKGVVILVR